MGSCQNYGPFLDPYYNTAPNKYGTLRGTIILITIQMAWGVGIRVLRFCVKDRRLQGFGLASLVGFRVLGLGFRVQGFRFRFRVQGFRFRV